MKMYGSLSDEDLNEWERLPLVMRVLCSAQMGAWLLRRDENKEKSEHKTERWIPVSERLPEESKKCLVAFKGGYVGIMCYASDLYGVDEYDFCDEKGMAGWFDYDRELGHYSRDDVIAWMSLPESYKAESEVET